MSTLTEAHTVTARQWLWFLGWWPEDRPDPTPNAREWENMENDADYALLHPRLQEILFSCPWKDLETLMWIGEFGHIPLEQIIFSHEDPEEMAAFNATVAERKRTNKWPKRLRQCSYNGPRRLPSGPPIRPCWLVVTNA